MENSTLSLWRCACHLVSIHNWEQALSLAGWKAGDRTCRCPASPVKVPRGSPAWNSSPAWDGMKESCFIATRGSLQCSHLPNPERTKGPRICPGNHPSIPENHQNISTLTHWLAPVDHQGQTPSPLLTRPGCWSWLILSGSIQHLKELNVGFGASLLLFL